MNAADTLVAFGMSILMFVCSQLIRQPATVVSQRDADGKRVFARRGAISRGVEIQSKPSNAKQIEKLHEEANE